MMNKARRQLYTEMEALMPPRRETPVLPLPEIDPPLKNARHEIYIQQVLAGKTLKEAYLAAGYSRDPSSIKGNAGKLRHRPDIAKRIESIQQYEAVAISRDLLFRVATMGK